MARIRTGILAGALGVLATMAAVAACADPTEIVVEIYSDACPPSGRSGRVAGDTAITVSSKEAIDRARPSAVKSGCDAPASGLVGTVTIYPSGANDGEVTFRVLTAVDRPIGACSAADGWAGCIEQSRTMRFSPRTTQRVVITQSIECLNRRCPDDQVCVAGACFEPGSVQEDGGTATDAARSDATIIDAPAVDGAVVPGTDAGDSAVPKPCPPGCTGPRQTCEDGVCVTTCPVGGACTGEVCPPNQDCVIRCQTSNACSNVKCSTGKSCRFECTSQNSCQNDLSCAVPRCDVHCAANNACSTLNLSGGDATVTCTGNKACGDTVACSATKCTLTCAGASCPTSKACSSAMCEGEF